MQYALYANKIHHGLLECNNYSRFPHSDFFGGESKWKSFYIAACWDEGKWDVIFLRCSLASEQPEYKVGYKKSIAFFCQSTGEMELK